MKSKRNQAFSRADCWLWLLLLFRILVSDTLAHSSAATRDVETAPIQANQGLYLFTGEQIDPDLGMYYLRARYYEPATGRFWTMDTYEGIPKTPPSLHKYSYCHANPIAYADPSGHFVSGFQLNAGAIQSAIGSQLASAAIRIPGHIAARGFTKWAWIFGGIGAGVQTLMQDTELGMSIQLSFLANPTGSSHAYKVYECVQFAIDAETFFRNKGKQPKRIHYQSRSHRTVGDNIIAAPGFGFFGGDNIAINGHHEGVLVDGRVYDNNVPFGVPRASWESGYLVTSWPEFTEMPIGHAARPEVGVGDITVQ